MPTDIWTSATQWITTASSHINGPMSTLNNPHPLQLQQQLPYATRISTWPRESSGYVTSGYVVGMYGDILPLAPAPASAPSYAPHPLPTRPEIARRQFIGHQRYRVRELRQRVATRRAERLLMEHLSDRQRESWNEDRCFYVQTADGEREYRIEEGLAGNIWLAKLGVAGDLSTKLGDPLAEGMNFCAHVDHPDGHIPYADNVLAQKLLLESPGGEAQFLAIANVT